MNGAGDQLRLSGGGPQNLKLFSEHFRRGAAEHANGFYAANKQFIAPLPIRIPEDPQAGEIGDLGRRLHASAAAIGEERRSFLAWLADAVGRRWQELEGKTKLQTYELLATGEVLGILRRNADDLGRSPDERGFRDELDRTLETSRARLADLQATLDADQRAADRLVYELYELTEAQRTLIDADYGVAG